MFVVAQRSVTLGYLTKARLSRKNVWLLHEAIHAVLRAKGVHHVGVFCLETLLGLGNDSAAHRIALGEIVGLHVGNPDRNLRA